MKNNCQICGKEYDCCPDCLRRGTWKAITCCPEHYQIHHILREYREDILTAKEATERLADCGITDGMELNLLESVERDVKIIISKGSPKRVSKIKNKSEDKVDKPEEQTGEE